MDKIETRGVTAEGVAAASEACRELMHGLLHWSGGLIILKYWLCDGKGIHSNIMNGTLDTDDLNFLKGSLPLPVGDEPYNPKLFCEAVELFYLTFFKRQQEAFSQSFTSTIRHFINLANLDKAVVPHSVCGPFTTIHSAAGVLAMWVESSITELKRRIEENGNDVDVCLVFKRESDDLLLPFVHLNFDELIEQECFRATNLLPQNHASSPPRDQPADEYTLLGTPATAKRYEALRDASLDCLTSALGCLECAINNARHVQRAKMIYERGPGAPVQEGDEEASQHTPKWYFCSIEEEVCKVRRALKAWQEWFAIDLKNAIVMANVDKLVVPRFLGASETAHETAYEVAKLVVRLSYPGESFHYNANWNDFKKIEEHAKSLHNEICGLQLELLIRQEWARATNLLRDSLRKELSPLERWRDEPVGIHVRLANDHCAEVAPSGSDKPSRKRPGRKKADYETVKREAELAAEWERARADVFKPEFARAKEMTLKQFDAMLGRVRKRNSRAD